MLLGCIADDFTGAGDVANALARGGMRTRMFIGVPAPGSGACDAGVIALKSRSIPAADAVEQSMAALRSLRAAGCRQFLFKYCSTFDSTPHGNIGPVALALARELDVRGVIVCPAFPATGRTVYQGHLFVGDRLLSESGMERHPLTPMTDPDIRRWLAAQCGGEQPGHVRYGVVANGAAAIRRDLARHADEGRTLVVVDALSEDDLHAIGRAAVDAALLTGGSGVALGLPANFRAAGLLSEEPTGFVPGGGEAVVLAGSCSAVTRGQVAAHLRAHPGLAVDPDRLIAGEPVKEEAETFIERHRGELPLIYSSADPDEVRSAQHRHGSSAAAEAIETFFGRIAAQAAASSFGRIVVAGGETSGAVTTALGVRSLDIGAEIDPGVPAMSTRDVAGRPLALALKSGNFGTPDFFAKAAAALGERCV